MSQVQTRPDAATSPAARRRMGARDLALVATFAALLAVFGLAGKIAVPGLPVPITLQSLAVMLAGAILGAKRGAAAVLLLLALAALGLPVLSGGTGGLAPFAGPTAGYMAGWVLGAALIGALVQMRAPRVPTWWMFLACVLGGIGMVYLLGIPVLAARAHLDLLTAAQGNVVFLPGDLVKAVLATVVAGGVHRAVPDLLPPLRRR